MSILRFLGLLALSTVSVAAQQHFVYLLAGQSNIANLADPANGAPIPALQLPNVTYFLPAPSNQAPAPMMELGFRLGMHHGSSNQVDIVQIAVSGSALEQTNNAGFGWWHPEPSILTLVRPGLQTLPATQLRIVWSQGETDMLASIPEDQYVGTAQWVFDTLSAMFPTVPAEVYLVVPGALDKNCNGMQVAGAAADSVRDAYNAMHDQVAPSIPTRIVAHHYDLKHALIQCPSGSTITDVHLSASGYVELGKRIADGIINPGTYFDITGSVVVSPTAIDLRLTGAAMPPPAQANKLFATTIRTGTTVVQTFPTSVTAPAAGVLRLKYIGVNFTAATGIEVRHVPGAGTSLDWEVQAVHSTLGLPLASRLVRVR